MASTIGIKIANGEFYSLVNENAQAKKRLILTTVHDKQRSVQIDLYKSAANTMADAVYIGSLVVEKIKPKPKGEPSIEMIISSSDDGTISAEAIDLDSSPQGDHQYLNVSLRSLEEDNLDYEIPDFELETNDPPPTGLLRQAKAVETSGERETGSNFPWPAMVIAAAAALLVIGAGCWFFFFRDAAGSRAVVQTIPITSSPARQSQSAPAQPSAPQAAQPAQAETPPPAALPAEQPPVIQAPVQAPPPQPAVTRERTLPPVASYRVPAVIPREGAPYRIRWGDTLWDIADAFYRNPWLYPRIARFNNIRNPDRIISGTTIRIPPRN